jgi:hypothetical protein
MALSGISGIWAVSGFHQSTTKFERVFECVPMIAAMY